MRAYPKGLPVLTSTPALSTSNHSAASLGLLLSLLVGGVCHDGPGFGRTSRGAGLCRCHVGGLGREAHTLLVERPFVAVRVQSLFVGGGGAGVVE